MDRFQDGNARRLTEKTRHGDANGSPRAARCVFEDADEVAGDAARLVHSIDQLHLLSAQCEVPHPHVLDDMGGAAASWDHRHLLRALTSISHGIIAALNLRQSSRTLIVIIVTRRRRYPLLQLPSQHHHRDGDTVAFGDRQ
jgi:hypothetical protein